MNENITPVGAADNRMQNVFESYMALLAEIARRSKPRRREFLRLGDRIPLGSVPTPLASSSRSPCGPKGKGRKTQALADLARLEQDLQKQVGAQVGALTQTFA